MSAIWSHLTCPPQPPHPVRISDDVFLPVPTPTAIRTSSSEPSLSFELKGLKVLAKEDGEKEVVKVSEVKMRRRNTLLMTPGEVHKLGTLSFLPSQIQPRAPTTAASTSCKPAVPKTPQPIRRVASDMSTPSSTYSTYESDDSNSEYDSCSSSFSTPCSSTKGYKSNKKHDQLSSPCPSQPSSKILDSAFLTGLGKEDKGTFGQNSKSKFKIKINSKMDIDGLPSTSSAAKASNFKFWRSPETKTSRQNCFSSPVEEYGRDNDNGNVKRRRISQIDWEGMPCPEEFVSPKTKQRVNELGRGFSWATLH